MMDTKYFPMFHSYLETLAGLTDEQFGRVIRAALQYSAEGTVPELEGMETMAFAFIKQDVDRAREKYEAIAERNRVNGMKGGRPRKQEKPSGFSENPKNPEEPKKPIETETETETENEKENAIEKATTTGVNGARVVGGTYGRKSGFVIPSVSDVAGYCVDHGYTHVDVEEFVKFYDDNGWTVGDGEPMKSWKAVLCGWEERARKKPKPSAPAASSFDTDDFFDAALKRTYGENWQFFKEGSEQG